MVQTDQKISGNLIFYNHPAKPLTSQETKGETKGKAVGLFVKKQNTAGIRIEVIKIQNFSNKRSPKICYISNILISLMRLR